MRVIIVEDEIRIREGIIKLLSKSSEEFDLVGEAENGQDGLKLLREKKPDVVITDIRMPIMDGLEMLTQMAEEKMNTKAIVLSAYSEFEYARKAMKLGVTEYLLKPISYHDFMQALMNVKLQVEKERQEKPTEIGTIEQIFQFIINGRIKISEEVTRYLENNYQIQRSQSFVVICAYLGSEYTNVLEKTKNDFRYALSMYRRVSYCMVEESYRNSLFLILYHYEDSKDLERWLQYQILKNNIAGVAFGWVESDSLEELKTSIEKLFPYMDWNITLDKEVLISYPKITQVQTVSCVYPIELETKMKTIICANEWDKVLVIMDEFQKSFQEGKVYAPKEIKECYVRFLWVMISIAKEIGVLEQHSIDLQKLLEMVMSARTKEELSEAIDYLVKALIPKTKKEETTHLTVKKVTSIIHEFYQSGITLEEISVKLNMTPEYIGTLFHKEKGITFGAYMKNYRINKAKELLCGSQYKLYEISEKVGYNDPKYFSKVFKEVTGLLPTDYRKTYK